MGRRNIGLFLSGGLDSTSILYEMKELGVKPRTFTSSFATTDPQSQLNQDSKLAERVCKEWNIENNVLYQTQQDYVDALENITVGDNVLTSSLGNIVPAGIPIGRVYQVKKPMNCS